MNMGLAHLARFCFEFVCFLVLHFLIWGLSFLSFVFFETLGSYVFIFTFEKLHLYLFGFYFAFFL